MLTVNSCCRDRWPPSGCSKLYVGEGVMLSKCVRCSPNPLFAAARPINAARRGYSTDSTTYGVQRGSHRWSGRECTDLFIQSCRPWLERPLRRPAHCDRCGGGRLERRAVAAAGSIDAPWLQCLCGGATSGREDQHDKIAKCCVTVLWRLQIGGTPYRAACS